jgi:LuxR family maltose regulon positive regulatory protein
MAALSLRRERDIPGFIAAFTGSQRYILDYLIEEVLMRQPAEVQDFLVKTSVLERLSAPLCDIVTGGTDSRSVLAGIERANLFIVPLDESREWYRYEHLFTELLRHQLEISTDTKGVSELHQRASRWYQDNGFPNDAIQHSLAARDWERAMSLIYDMSERQKKTGEMVTLLGWL